MTDEDRFVKAFEVGCYPAIEKGSKLQVEDLDVVLKTVTFWMPWSTRNPFKKLWYKIKCGHKEIVTKEVMLKEYTYCTKCKMIRRYK